MSAEIETERLRLRLPRPDDCEGAAVFLTDLEVMRFLGGVVVPREDVPRVVEKWRARWDLFGLGPFVVERREDGTLLGRVGYLLWDTRTWRQAAPDDLGAHSQAELGWALARAYWGKGYATEAAHAARDWVRSESPARDRAASTRAVRTEVSSGPAVRRSVSSPRASATNSLISLVHPDNVRSRRVAERLGAHRRETVELFDGGPADVWVHPE